MRLQRWLRRSGGRIQPACACAWLLQVAAVSLAPGAPVSSVALDTAPGRPLAVPLVAGTPRYLLFRNVYNEDLRPPKVVPNCSILFQVSHGATPAGWRGGTRLCHTLALSSARPCLASQLDKHSALVTDAKLQTHLKKGIESRSQQALTR